MIKTSLRRAIGKWEMERNEKLSIPGLADLLRMDKGFLYRFDNGDIQRLDLDKLDQLCQFFRVTPDDLIWHESPPAEEK